MKKKPMVMPKFINEAQEAEWWASREGRQFVKQKAAGTGKKGGGPRGSRLVGELNKVASVQIALRLPEPDVAKARELATRKGIGYHTLIKFMKGFAAKRDGRERFATGRPLGRGVGDLSDDCDSPRLHLLATLTGV